MRDSSLSAQGRERAWSALSKGVFDLLVVGGGITGCGIAQNAAGRGLRVALVEAGDLAAGTSSRSSRLIHGGLRYLETFDFPLVFEALRERRRLLELAPHLVQPLSFAYPVYRGDPTGLAKLAAGMWMYETLSLFRSPRRHRILRREGLLAEEPLLRSDGLTGGAIYYDAQVDDARLTLAVARAAHEAGATVVTRARVERIAATDDGPFSVRIRDGLAGREGTVSARLVVNATGPWSDRVRSLADSAIQPRLRLTKGTHILVDRTRIGNRSAIIFRSIVDGRVMFVLPWGDFTYAGTTDTEYDGDPGEAEADADDVQYLLDSVNAIFPEARLGEDDVLSTWAGIRPLLAPATERGLSASATSREHAIWRDRSGLLNVAGGKLTTYRSMAAEAVDEAATLLAREFGVESGRYYTELLPLPGAPEPEGTTGEEAAVAAEGAAATPPEVRERLARRYGDDYPALLILIAGRPGLADRIVPGHPAVLAEVVHAVRSELALTVEDVLRRRLHLFYETPDGGLPAIATVANLVAQELGAGSAGTDMRAQIASYTEAVRRTRPWRKL